jgi:hypothetical protein
MVDQNAVTTTTSIDVPTSAAVAAPMYLESASHSHTTTALVNATRSTTSTQLNFHPDRGYVNNVLHDILYGVNIGYTSLLLFRVNKKRAFS